jgi:hypothetical protein
LAFFAKSAKEDEDDFEDFGEKIRSCFTYIKQAEMNQHCAPEK